MPGFSPPLSVRWSVNVGGTASYPIITGGKVFVIGGGSPSGLYALDEQTGSIIWSQATPAGYGGWVGATYDNGVLFVVPYDVPGLNSGAMFAFSADDGHQIWSTTLPGQSFFTSAPTAVNGIVYTGGAEIGGTVYAVRESDGTLLWTGSVENGDSSAPAVTADGMYVSYACPQSYRFNPTNGLLLWHYVGICEGGGGDSVAIYQGLVYVRDTLNNYPTDGITLSTTNGLYQGGFNSKYSPAFWQNTAFYTEQNSLTAVDLTSSQPLWIALPQSGDSFSCAPIVVNGVVYSGTANGNLYGYSSATGSTVFSANLGPSISCPEYSNVPLPGLSAGDGLLVVPVGSQVVALQFTGSPSQLVLVTPCRVVDTRNTNGTFGGPAIGGNSSRSFPLSQSGNPCNIPSSAVAYSLNVTVVPETTLGYLTIWPTGEGQPVVSTMNSPDGRIKANAAIVPAGNPSGSVSVYVTNTTNVILDIDGYFAQPGSGTYQFYPLTPCRIVDTRNNQDKGTLQAGVERDYSITGTCGIPSNAAAYSFNVTVLPAAGGLDYLTVWPKGESQPVVSTLNDNTGTVVANAAIVPAGSENATAFYPHNNNTDLLVDVNGYFAAPGTGGFSLYPVAPCRVLDTRHSGGSFIGEKNVNVEGSACAPPANAAAYVFNATVVPPGHMLYLTLWPDGEKQPVVSTLNAQDGFITSNMAIVPTNNGSIDAYAYALTQLILDISGYFAP